MINASGGNPTNNQKPPTQPPATPVTNSVSQPSAVQNQATPSTTQTTQAPTQPPAATSQTPPTTPPINPNQPAQPQPATGVGGNNDGSSQPPKAKLKKAKKKLPWKMIAGAVGLLVVLIGAGAGYFLTQVNQDVRQQASQGAYNIPICLSSGTTECIDNVVYECLSPGSPYQKTNPEEPCGQTACEQQKGSSYQNEVDACNAATNTEWNDTLCRCISNQTNCFSLDDQCQTFNVANCGPTGEPDNTTSFPNSTSCQTALADSGFEECTESEIAVCTQAGGTCVYNESLNRGTCQGVTAGDTCSSNAECRVNGGNLVCEQSRCVQPPPNTGGPTASPSPSPGGDATGTGSCAACLGLGGGQAERDCYAQCSGTIATGICAGMTTTQCAQACSAAGGTTQICTGTQEPAGSSRAGEFLSCGASSVNGCGQVDCIDSSGSLIGFVIDNSQCTGTGGTTPPTTNPTVNPSASPTTNPTITPTPSASATVSATPSPTPTLNPELAQCNESCTVQSDCADLQHTCYQGVCRLIDYEERESCDIPGEGTPTPVPVSSPVPASCNESCNQNSDCDGFNIVCDQTSNRCRLSSNLTSQSCSERVVTQSSTTQLGQMNQQPQAPSELPTAGATDFSNWILSGLGALAVGAVILLLL